jgi:cytoskeletal protein RodZ
MQKRKKQGTMRRGTSTRLVGWSVIVGLALLASCASQSKSAPPPPAEPSQAPAAAESQAPTAPPTEQAAAEQEQPPAPAEETASPPATAKQTTVELVRQPERSAKAQPATSGSAAKKSGGCGDKDAKKATPKPSPTGPQPRFVCKQSKIEAEPVWQGTDAIFVFEVANEGEGKLDIKIKGG